MKIKLSAKKIKQLHAECLLLPMYENKRSPLWDELNILTNNAVKDLVELEKFKGEYKKTLVVSMPHAPFQKIFILGLGKASKLKPITLIQALQQCGQQLQKLNCTSVLTRFDHVKLAGTDASWLIKNLVLALAHANYQYTATMGKKPRSTALESLTIQTTTSQADLSQAVTQAQAIAAGQCLTRDLGNLPGNICTPEHIAKTARKLARHSKKFTIKVLEERHMEKLNMGAFLSVSRGSVHPGKLVCIEYRNGPRRQAPIVLVGKGVTFDTGGISLKPSAAMDEMKFDMSGAGTVLGTLKACSQMKLPINLVGVLACAENMPGGNASKPGDVVKTMSGQTVEILNTDAEGRLVLCDALSYVERNYKPQYIIDIATLTGACVVALGQHAAGLFSNDTGLAKNLLEAGEQTADRAWQLPLWEDYQSQLDSNFADFANIGGRWGGAITAACFLARFTKKLHWAHLDIAGVAWNTGKEKGATGRPVSLLSQFLINACEQQQSLP